MAPLDFLPFVIALGIAAAIPGPGIAAMVGKALGSGFRPALLFGIGLALGDLVYLSLAVLGLAAIVHLFAGLFTLIKIAGAAYLFYLAWQFWRAGISPEKLLAARAQKGPALLLGGFALTLGNPKVIVFYLALLPTVIDLRHVGAMDFAVLVVLTLLVLSAVLLPYIALAARARLFLTDPKRLKLLNRGAATAIAGAATFILVRE